MGSVSVKWCHGSCLIYLGAVHELPCQAYVLNTAGTQQGLNKDLQQSGRRVDIMQRERWRLTVHCRSLNSVVQEVDTHNSMCGLGNKVTLKEQVVHSDTLNYRFRLFNQTLLAQI